MSAESATLSLIVPSRGRVAQLRRMLAGLVETANHPEALEVVLVVDSDDPASHLVRREGLNVRTIVVPPGLTMGALNTAGYEASFGRYLMLLNDDVVALTPGWDDKVLARLSRFPDGVVLVHVNDTLLRDNLCTFPIVSRAFCALAGGICPVEYVRYRIDDHIEDVFNLLARLGHTRTIYLPDVVFQHCNAVEVPHGPPEYHSLPDVLALDAPRFLELFPRRKQFALELLARVEGPLTRARLEEARRTLETISDPFTLRTPSRHRVETDEPARRRAWRFLRRQTGRVLAAWRRGVACYRSKGGHGLLRAVGRRLSLFV
jgi:hypothetical protein